MNSLAQRRFNAIRETMARVRSIAPDPVISDAQLQALKAPLIELASRSELFPADQFATAPGKPGTLYELSVDGDLRYALYASAGVPGKLQPPHNHTTWALISGVFGDEHNVGYERTSETTVEKRWELTCRRGNAVAFQPDDFHTIEVTSQQPTLHLHMYGRSLAHLPDRVFIKDQVEGRWQGPARRFMARPEMYSPYISAGQLREMLADGEELAVIDVRDGGVFAQSHLLTASNIALSDLELAVPRLLPRKSVRVVLVDDSVAYTRGQAQIAAQTLRRYGYLNLAVLAGGVTAWKDCGYEIFSGIFVPSKAFGEVVEHAQDTPRIEAEVLRQWQADGRKMVVLDSRPMDEYTMMSIPGAADCPGAELVYRVPQLVRDDDTTIVVNCAGRTRSIIGAQSLRNAGFRNPIFALKNGTMGWHLSGLKVAKGADNMAPEPDAAALARAREHAAGVARRWNIPSIGLAALQALRTDETRTTYVYDVRLREAYLAGHLPGSLNAPGGQLVQATDTFAPARNARLVLIDEHQVQSIMTAHWLKQMGWNDVSVLEAGRVGAGVNGLSTGEPPLAGLGEAMLAAPQVDVSSLKSRIDAGEVEVIDVGASLKYRKARIPGAWYAMRSRLAACLERFARDRPLVFVCSDGRVSRYAAADAIAFGFANVSSLIGGLAAWYEAGLVTEAAAGDNDPKFLCPTEDVWYRPYDKNNGVEQAMQQYLTWEVNLVAQLERETYLQFSV